jgi:heterodisulfide reductase subunit A-like polyferredoxin
LAQAPATNNSKNANPPSWAENGSTAIVLGGGIGGIAAAGALSPYFDRIVVIERDPPEAYQVMAQRIFLSEKA